MATICASVTTCRYLLDQSSLAGASHSGPKTSVKDSTKFLGFLGRLLRQGI